MRENITTQAQLRELLGKPHPLTQRKIYDHLFPQARAFIARSPLVFLATSSADGQVTVSPKGDAPGFLKIINDQQLLIPERPGNKLLHGLGNILDTGRIGLILLVPGMDETLRINGRCRLFRDKQLCAEFTAHGKPALLLMEVDIEQCFFHCGKAFKRSAAWQPEAWPEPVKLSFGEQIAANTARNKLARKALAPVVDAAVKSDYKHNL